MIKTHTIIEKLTVRKKDPILNHLASWSSLGRNNAWSYCPVATIAKIVIIDLINEKKPKFSGEYVLEIMGVNKILINWAITVEKESINIFFTKLFFRNFSLKKIDLCIIYLIKKNEYRIIKFAMNFCLCLNAVPALPTPEPKIKATPKRRIIKQKM